MPTRTRHVLAWLVGLLMPVMTTPSYAQELASVSITIGQVHWVTRSDGSEIKGVISGQTPVAIQLDGPAGPMTIPNAEVVRITKPDGLRDGWLIGGGIGLAWGLGYALSDEASASAGRKAVGTLAMAAISGAIGAVIDRAIERRTVVFRRIGLPAVGVAPLVQGRHLGLRASFRW